MKNENTDSDEVKETEEMLPEYDFSQGEQGKHYKAYREGHSVRINKIDGTTETRYFTLEEGAVLLEPDIREYFPNSESVNETLRSLISLIPQKTKKELKTTNT